MLLTKTPMFSYFKSHSCYTELSVLQEIKANDIFFRFRALYVYLVFINIDHVFSYVSGICSFEVDRPHAL